MGNMQGLKPGAMLRHDTYRIERMLGQGGFGITYLATDLSLDRLVAIKEFFPKDYCDRDATTSHVTLGSQSAGEFVNKLKAKFLKEARNIAKLDHPGIIKIHAAFEENNTAYYVMDYIEGESLSEMVKKHGPLPEAKAIEYIRKVGEALEYVHSKSINHLDVKPANIMVRRSDDNPVLIDFGLSKQYDSSGSQTSTTPTGISHGYAPMEQYNDGGVREFSPQTDLYSLAATLYYLLSGIRPPQATKLIENELTFPEAIPQRLIGPISKAMSPTRRERHETVRKFISDITNAKSVNDDTVIVERAKQTSNPEPKPSPTPKPNPAPTPNPIPQPKTKRNLYIGLGAAAVVIIAIMIFAFAGGKSSNVEEAAAVDSSWVNQDYVLTEEAHALAEEAHAPAEATVKEGTELTVTGSINGHEYVDLGLSVKWATCNVGASSPEDYGNYYAWGETAPKSKYTEENSLIYGKSRLELKQSGIVNSAGVLNKKYDAASANWGSTWRMPTRWEFDELISKCTWTWTTQGGNAGYLVTGTNGNSIFLPAAGYRKGSSLESSGGVGSYWLSLAGDITSHSVYLVSFYSGRYGTEWYVRYVGSSVRPVSE